MSGVMSSSDSPGSLQLCYHHQRMENKSVLLPMESRQYRQAYRKQQQSHGSVQDTNSPPTSGGTPGCSSDESQPDIDLDCVPTEELNSDQKRYRRIQANKRERKRMHTVNEAFDDLRDLVPTYPSNRKLSKIETLRLACAYIQDLAKLLSESTAVHGEDVNLHHCEAGFIPSTATTLQHSTSNSYPAAVAASNTMKTEFVTSTEFNSCNFQHYRVPLSYDYESCPSDPEIQSPPHFPNNVYIPSGLAVKPPALARVSSDTAVSLQMAQTSLATSSSSGYCGSPAAITPCSPLTRVQHSSPSLSHNVPSNFSSPPNHHFNAHHHYQHQMLTGYAHCYSQ